jgi:hypothetical protein
VPMSARPAAKRQMRTERRLGATGGGYGRTRIDHSEPSAPTPSAHWDRR